ncbi:unnamed protein product [Anisakis simplex]|uniref:ES2 similar protein 2 (inferred by orthology to a C. elegans protein) n=1 Tax=Anisakis simplex TaxID=6269 RepID=A0A0M3J6A6_ANISI|nr:unnamed protein product [Anisakis simplex]
MRLNSARPKELDNWTYQARNAVLFDIEEKPLTMQEHFERQKMNQRQINKQATRFTEDAYPHSRPNSMQRASILSSSNQPGKVDISGQEINQGKHGDFDLVVTPSPAPGVDDSPFMTWGEIEGTPFRLDASDMPMTGADGNAPTFKIPEVPIREKIAQEMTETIAKRYRDKRKAAIRQIEKHARTPRFGSTHSTDRLLSMSPAAMRLATKGLGIRLNSDKALKASYTPSPTRYIFEYS